MVSISNNSFQKWVIYIFRYDHPRFIAEYLGFRQYLKKKVFKIFRSSLSVLMILLFSVWVIFSLDLIFLDSISLHDFPKCLLIADIFLT